jgi:hypothetical protein
MNIDDRIRAAKQAGYLLLSQDDGQEIYGRDDLPSTVEFNGNEWTQQLRDFNLDPVGHQHLGDARLHPVVACNRCLSPTPTTSSRWSATSHHRHSSTPPRTRTSYIVPGAIIGHAQPSGRPYLGAFVNGIAGQHADRDEGRLPAPVIGTVH